jgi:hypothetical protein
VPLTRPAEISNGVSLSDKVAGRERPFVSEQTALDTFLLWNSFVEMLSPHKGSIAWTCPKNDVRTWADTLPLALPS